MEEVKPDIRHLNDMREMFSEAKDNENPPLYYMYRGVERDNDLRYDITVIPPLMFGSEYNKTKGHYHYSHPELYVVLKGQAIFLIQKGIDEISEVYFIKAKEGDAIIIPNNSGHFTINPTADTVLELSNWSSINSKFDYKPVEIKKGACYYYTTKGWIKNQNYKQVPELKQKEPLNEIPKDLTFLR
jgi:glucose-6-phosphate isomerase